MSKTWFSGAGLTILYIYIYMYIYGYIGVRASEPKLCKILLAGVSSRQWAGRGFAVPWPSSMVCEQ